MATDSAGYQRTSAVIASRRVDNTQPSAALADPGAYLTGTVALSATASDTGSGLAALAIEHRAPGGSWTTLCTGAGSPRSCNLPTAALPDGPYELRAVATDAAGNQRTSELTRTVDNTAPTVSLAPLGPVRGTLTVPVTASDGAGTGIASITVQARIDGAWTDACTDAAAPWACDGLDTSVVPDGLYDLRATAVDGTGRSTTSNTISVRVDNTAPATATLTDPGATLRGSVALSGTAVDAGSGVASWAVQYRLPAGTWATACSDATSPYTCSWATAAVADGTYELRALVTDVAGNTTTSAALTNRRVDNTAPSGTGIQATNGGATQGRLESGDRLTLTYSEQLAPASVLSGWTGTGTAIRVRVANAGTNDQMDLYNATGATRLNLVLAATDLVLGGNFVSGTAWFNATMTQNAGGTITIVFGSVISGSTSVTTASTGTLSWRPSNLATDLAGNAALTTQVTESGTADRDF